MKARIARFVALLLLIFSGAAGLFNAWNQIGDDRTALQATVTIGVLLYGVFGLAAAVGVLVRRRWSTAAVIAWAVAITYVSAVAPRAFGGPDVPLAASIMSGVATAAIALGVLWAARVATRPLPA